MCDTSHLRKTAPRIAKELSSLIRGVLTYLYEMLRRSAASAASIKAMIEAFWSRMQVELLDRQIWRTRPVTMSSISCSSVTTMCRDPGSSYYLAPRDGGMDMAPPGTPGNPLRNSDTHARPSSRTNLLGPSSLM